MPVRGKPPPGLPPLEPDGQQWARRVAQLERHMRENKLRQHTSFVDELGRAQSDGEQVRSTKEAKRLAFDIFWNARTDYSRSAPAQPSLHSFRHETQEEEGGEHRS